MANQPELLVDELALLGEGPLWLPESKTIIWVDIEGMCIHLYTPGTEVKEVISVGERIGAVVPAADGRMVCALQSGFAYLDLTSKSLERIADPEEDQPENRFNDGKCDPAGRFWAGTMPLAGDSPDGALYRLDGDGKISTMLVGVGCSNGLAWDAEATTLYYIDTPTGRVDQFDYDVLTGNIKNRRTAFHLPPGQGSPDGMTIDLEGMLWVAHWGGSCVSRWNPVTGKCLETVSLPVSQVTSCCFGGENLDELYITSARDGLSEEQLQDEPLAGGIFKYTPGVRGVAANVFKNR
ncbi:MULTISPECIES: SMP-30/gluconolactonase/LRE family protein [Paenibacillus]|uniref:SMP-30/gluconolactonase/LRE family protein n=1 Tax=Paenibacillus TaxID=44249 RepID=UPI001F47B5D6|nr:MULTISPECIES: SMP-30/gluconolactonase/LRE family protein [Paenibacillus]